jgi:hypothetical protein
VVEAFAAQRADEAFGDGVRSRCLDWGAEDADVGAGEHRVEGGGELAVPVADQEPELLGVVAEVHQEVAGLLGERGVGGVGGDPRDVRTAAVVFVDDEDVEDEDVEMAQEHGIDVGEADREDRVGLRGEELSPGRPGPSRSGIEASFLEDRLPGSASAAT